jgi:hypothetical protein
MLDRQPAKGGLSPLSDGKLAYRMKRRLGDGRDVLILEPARIAPPSCHAGPAAAGSPRSLPRRLRATLEVARPHPRPGAQGRDRAGSPWKAHRGRTRTADHVVVRAALDTSRRTVAAASREPHRARFATQRSRWSREAKRAAPDRNPQPLLRDLRGGWLPMPLRKRAC